MKYGVLHKILLVMETAFVGWVCEEINATTFPSSVRFHHVSMYDDVYYGLHCCNKQ